MKHTLALILIAVLAWYAPEYWTTGEPIQWDETADLAYIPCYSPYPDGPWTDLPYTELLWADVPVPPAGGTLYYSCRAVYCPAFICGTPSSYAPSISLTAPEPEPSPEPNKKGWGKGGKRR